jgi:superfamily II DNA or RNA helicase
VAIRLAGGEHVLFLGGSMAVQLREDDLRRAFDAATLRKGAAICERDCVRHIELSADGSRISSSVLGSRPKPYSQTITFAKAADGRLRIKGYCSCPVGVNCKHLAAVLLEHLALHGDGDDEVRPDRVPPAPSLSRVPATQPTRNAPLLEAPKPASTLSAQTSRWLERLASINAAPAKPQSATGANQRVLLYVLDHENLSPPSSEPCVRIRPISARRRKDGSLTDEKFYNPENILRTKEQRPRFLTEADLETLRGLLWLMRMSTAPGSQDIVLGGDAASRRIFETLLQSGQLRYGALHGVPLRDGPPVRGEPRWVKAARGEQKLTFVPIDQAARADATGTDRERRFDAILPLSPPHYVDLAEGVAGAIETGLPHDFAVEVARAPTIAPSEAAIVKEMMRQRLKPVGERALEHQLDDIASDEGGAQILPLPEAPDNIEIQSIAPVPRLELMLADLRVKPQFAWYSREVNHHGGFSLPIARLSFDYGGEIIHARAPGQMVERMEDGRLILTPRDSKAEATAAGRLARLGFKPFSALPFSVGPEHQEDLFLAPPGMSSHYEILMTCGDPGRFLAFSADTVPELVKHGWQVFFSDDYPYRIAEGAADWWADIGEGSGIDWFSFEMGVEFEGHRINLISQLADILAKLPAQITELAPSPEKSAALVALLEKLKLYHTLPDGRLLPLPGARLAPILTALLELIGPRQDSLSDGKVRLHRAEAAALAAFAGEAGNLAWAASAERLIELGNKLRGRRALAAVKPPRTFKAKLRPYQSDGLAWLDFLRDTGFGGVLADDMGLGKTIQALAFLSREKAEGRLDKPALIVSPTSVLPNWQAEAERFAPELSVLALRGQERKALFAEIARHDIVLTTYPLLARDFETLLGQEFHAAILDEAQAIKNPKAAVSTIAHRIHARHRLALTGTPLENNLGEVWSLFQFLSPGLLGDESTFRRTFRTPIEKHGDAAAQGFLSSRLKPFLLRRTKQEVAPDLPPKTEIVEHIRLEGAQRDLYETVRSLMHARVRDEIAKKGLAKSHIVFLDALLKLRQICCDPRLLKMPQARKVKSSAKLERLMEMVPELVGEGRRILLFSQFTSMLALIEAELQARKIPYVQLTGDTVDRAGPVRAFQSGKAPIFLLSLKAGGTGLNLTAADTVIHYDPWWNPAVEAQATDRAYRIGQDKPVFVYKLVVEEGIEAAIEQLKARKAALAEALFAGSTDRPFDLTEADISALFAPLDRRAERKAA